MKKKLGMVLWILLLLWCGSALAENKAVNVDSREALYRIYEESIERCEQPPVMNVANFPVQWGLELDVKNVYFDLMADRPELQYAYDLTASIDNQGFLNCQIGYMPYYVGKFPEEFEGIDVNSLNELVEVANANLDKDSVSIRITNSELQIQDMNQALSSQAGNTYIFCTLNNDATQIVIKTAPLYNVPSFSKQEAIEKQDKIDELAEKIVNRYTTNDMTQMEKARALYSYIIENVVYDDRYYDDFEHFSDKARTALGALEDNLAICGGFAQALKVLFEKVNIPCYVVPGNAGEDHLWNVAKIENEWRLFDATFDSGRTESSYFNVSISETKDHQPYSDIVEKLIREVEE